MGCIGLKGIRGMFLQTILLRSKSTLVYLFLMMICPHLRIFQAPSLALRPPHSPSMLIRARLPVSPSTSRALLWPLPQRKGPSSASLTHRPRRSQQSSGEGLIQQLCTGENSLCLPVKQFLPHKLCRALPFPGLGCLGRLHRKTQIPFLHRALASISTHPPQRAGLQNLSKGPHG